MVLRVGVGPLHFSTKVQPNGTVFQNPGIGGSEYHSIMVAKHLQDSGFETFLILSGAKVVGFGIPTINAAELKPGYLDILIVTTMSAKSNQDLLSGQQFIAISHHPHDGFLRQLTRLKTCKAVVNVGEYQLWSNKTQRIPSIWLPGFTFPNGGSQSSLTPHTTDKILGYISSLHPSKGFHLLASKWASIEKVLPELKLEVIGGLNLYQTTKVDPEIPTSPTYAKEIRTKFGGQVPANVKFLGLIPNPVGHVIQRWSISIMNPSGIGESDPVVVRDCLAEGVPIIGPMRFGLIDYMRHWPELVIGRGRKIDRVLEEFFSNDTLRNELRNRALELHQCYLARSKSSLDGWVNLVNSVAARDHYAIRSSGLEVRVPSISERYSLALGAVETSLLRWSEKLQQRFRPLGQLIGFLREKIR